MRAAHLIFAVIAVGTSARALVYAMPCLAAAGTAWSDVSETATVGDGL